MSVVFAGKAFSGVLNDTANIYYTDPDLNAKIGMGEKFLVELRGSNPVSSPTAAVTIESSNDNINWTVRNTVIATTAISTTPIFGSEPGTSAVGGRFARFGIKLGAGSAYVELWITARQAL